MKKVISLLLALTLCLGLAACTAQQEQTDPAVEQTPAVEEEPVQETETDPVSCRIAGLKGPTTMGLVNLMKKAEEGQTQQAYEFSVYGTADEILPLLLQGELDVAAIPANLASTLYAKTEGQIQAMAVNTLGVLYVVTTDDSIQSLEDLKGRTVLSTGKGTTPEYLFRYLLNQAGIDPDKDLTLEYKSEATEVVAAMQADSSYPVAVLPQPYVTAAQAQMENLRVAISLTDEWNKYSENPLITGVTVVRAEFAQEHPEVMEALAADYKASVEAACNDLETTAALCEEYGIVASAAIAQKALPACNIVYMDGEEMKEALEFYLQVLYDADPASVGGALPGDDFYLAAS